MCGPFDLIILYVHNSWAIGKISQVVTFHILSLCFLGAGRRKPRQHHCVEEAHFLGAELGARFDTWFAERSRWYQWYLYFAKQNIIYLYCICMIIKSNPFLISWGLLCFCCLSKGQLSGYKFGQKDVVPLYIRASLWDLPQTEQCRAASLAVFF